MIKYNINYYVSVKLTEHGYKIHKEFWEDIYKQCNMKYQKPVCDENGYVKFQMWDLMRVFGKHIGSGVELPFETDVFLDEKI